MHDLLKLKLVTIHSATNPKRFRTLFFSTKKEIIDYLSFNFMIDFPKNISEDQLLMLIQDYKYFSINKYKDGYKLKTINYENNESIYSISAQIIANSRIKMVKTIETFLKHPTVEICYTNIDSIHISIEKSELNNFLSSHSNLISDKLGDLKIESISDQGYWFDIGRYWLIKDGSVIMFKNKFFKHRGVNKFFSDCRKFKILYKNNSFRFIKNVYASLYNAFSYNKKIVDNYNFQRYNYEEIYDLDVALETYSEEILRSKKNKIDLYKKIATVGVFTHPFMTD